MEAQRKKIVNMDLIEEFYWNGKPVVYVNNVKFNGTFEEAIKNYSNDK